jgi:hypothetical protein
MGQERDSRGVHWVRLWQALEGALTRAEDRIRPAPSSFPPAANGAVLENGPVDGV